MKVKLLEKSGGLNLVDQSCSAMRSRPMMSDGELLRPVPPAGQEATVKACGAGRGDVAWGMAGRRPFAICDIEGTRL